MLRSAITRAYCRAKGSETSRPADRESTSMKHSTILVRAAWDEEARVWVASSEDVQGLAVESESLEALQLKVMGALEDLIELNGLKYENPEIPVHFVAEQLSRLRNPAV